MEVGFIPGVYSEDEVGRLVAFLDWVDGMDLKVMEAAETKLQQRLPITIAFTNRAQTTICKKRPKITLQVQVKQIVRNKGRRAKEIFFPCTLA